MADTKKDLHTFLLGVLQSIVATIVMALLIALWQELRHHSIDWYGILASSVLMCIFLFFAIRLGSRQSRGLAEKEFTEKLEQTRKEITDEVSELIETKMHKVNASSPVDSAMRQIATQPMEWLTPLQVDSLRLSMSLLEFLRQLGFPPQPRYTADELHGLPLSRSKELIESNDGAYFEACEYHFGNGHLHIETAEGLQNLTMSRFMRLWPWYEKVKASYALDFKDKVERIQHRFTIEGLMDDGLSLPVDGRDGVKNIKAIAAKLWELAYKVEEKGIPVEKS